MLKPIKTSNLNVHQVDNRIIISYTLQEQQQFEIELAVFTDYGWHIKNEMRLKDEFNSKGYTLSKDLINRLKEAFYSCSNIKHKKEVIEIPDHLLTRFHAKQILDISMNRLSTLIANNTLSITVINNVVYVTKESVENYHKLKDKMFRQLEEV